MILSLFDLPDVPGAAAGLTLAGQLLAVHWLLVAVLLASVGLLLYGLPRTSAATRHGSWLGALILCALLPVGALLVNLGWVPDALRWQPTAALGVFAPATPSEPIAATPAVPDPRGEKSPRAGESASADAAAVAPSASTPSTRRLLNEPLANWLFAGWALLWGLVASRRVIRLAVAWRRTSRLRSQLVPPRPELAQRMQRVLARIGDGTSRSPRTVEVVELPRDVPSPSHAPFCLGALRPCVVVPAAWIETASPRDQNIALLHEAAHGLRRDGVALFAQQLLACMLPLHPVASPALRQLEIEREAACDDFVLRSGVSARSYGDSLLRQAERCLSPSTPSSLSSPAPPPVLSGDLLHTAYLGSPSQLARRLLAMTDSKRSRSNRFQWGPTLMVAAVLGGTAAVSLAAWPAFTHSGEASLALAGLALEEGQGSHRVSYRQRDEDRYQGRRVLSADDSSLYPAVRSGDVDRVERLLDAGEDPNEVWPGDGSPLMVAAHRGDADVVEVLLRRGADVDLAVGGDGTPLIGAVRSGNLDLVQRLIDVGADIDDAGFGGDGNPLIAASLAGDIVTARYLVQQGATIDIHVPDDDTPLINAAQQGHVDLVRYLLDEGADPNLTGDFDRRLNVVRTPLNQALAGDHTDVAQLLRAAGARN